MRRTAVFTPQPPRYAETACSFACLAAAAAWPPLCLALAAPGGLIPLPCLGACALLALGSIFGLAAIPGRGPRRWAKAAFALNALALLGVAAPLLLLHGPAG